MRVLLMQQKMIGDVLTCALLAENLRRLLPASEVHFLAHTNTHAVLAGNPHLTAVHGYPADAGWRSRLRLARQLRGIGFDALIDGYGKAESLLLTMQVRARRSIGYRKWYTRSVYSDVVRRAERAAWGLPLAIEHRLRLLEPLTGPLDPEQLTVHPRLYVSAEEHGRAREFLLGHGLDPGRPLLMVGALGSSPEKSYPLPAMARLLDRIATRCDAQILFNCLPSQRSEARQLRALCAVATQPRIVLDAWPSGLRDFIAVLAQCRALFGNEGGAANMARALDVPSFSIFSPQIPQEVWGSHDARHPSVHLAQFRPQYFDFRHGYGTVSVQAGPQLYRFFEPALIEPALDRFVAAYLGSA